MAWLFLNPISSHKLLEWTPKYQGSPPNPRKKPTVSKIYAASSELVHFHQQPLQENKVEGKNLLKKYRKAKLIFGVRVGEIRVGQAEYGVSATLHVLKQPHTKFRDYAGNTS